jgi:hypothetical protein
MVMKFIHFVFQTQNESQTKDKDKILLRICVIYTMLENNKIHP